MFIIFFAIYVSAATAFRSAKMTDKFIEATLKAATCYENSRSFFSAAKNYEQVGLASRDKNDWNSMIKYYEKACLYFRQHGVPDTAALTYNRGAGYFIEFLHKNIFLHIYFYQNARNCKTRKISRLVRASIRSCFARR